MDGLCRSKPNQAERKESSRGTNRHWGRGIRSRLSPPDFIISVLGVGRHGSSGRAYWGEKKTLREK